MRLDRFVDPWRQELLLIELDYDPVLLCRLLRCKEIEDCDIWDEADGRKLSIFYDKDSLSQIDKKPQFSFVPSDWYLN